MTLDNYYLYIDAGLNTNEKIADFFNVNERTVRNWKKTKPPHAVFLCLSIMGGKLDLLGKPWKGFRFTPDFIESPEKDFIHAYEIRAIRYVYQAAGIERFRVCNTLKRQIAIKKRNMDKDLSESVSNKNIIPFRSKEGLIKSDLKRT